MGAMAKRRKIFAILAGLTIGVCFSQLAKFGDEMCKADGVRTRPLEASPLTAKQNTEEQLLFVGVMTAAGYLETRAKACHDTWGIGVPGKILFFSSEHSRTTSVPLVPLIGVDDSYPPQKKSFAMLRYMYDNYLEHFEWFMRADDDVYVRTDKLEVLLRSVDSRKPWFIGQTGRGNSEEFGLLSLESDENFCMGGPGIILSRETLRRIGPHIEECLENLYTTHEDVELGRCVKRMAGVSCTWSYEASDYTSQMQVILYHNQSGRASFTGDLKQKEIHKAITLHPIKEPKYMYRLHKYVEGLRIQSNKEEAIRLHRDIAMSMSELDIDLESLESSNLVEGLSLFPEKIGSDLYVEDPKLLGIPAKLNRFRPSSLKDVLDWEFVSKSWYSYKDLNPKRRLGSSSKEGLGDVVREVMEIINLYSKQRGRVIDFKEIFYGYWRLDPVHGVDLILDLLLVYKKYRGHKMTVPVRRHAYIQQTFTGLLVREVPDSPRPDDRLPLHRKIFDRVLGQIPTIFSSSTSADPKINFVLPLSGRYETFERFLDVYEHFCLSVGDNTRLVVVLYKNPDLLGDFIKSRDLVDYVKSKHGSAEIDVRFVDEPFSRGRAVQHGVDLCDEDDLMFFVDVDMTFDRGTLLRIRRNTRRNSAVYFPIVYSMYERPGSERGTWRKFGFGIVSLYKSDYVKLGGLNTTINGWGFEDVAFYDAAVRSDVGVVRSVDVGLVHVHHAVACDPELDATQMSMCRGSQASTYAPLGFLQERFVKYRHMFS